MQQRKNFYSKILLFGEYALIVGSEALSVPYRELYGSFVFGGKSGDKAFDSNGHLKKYAGYLRRLFQKGSLPGQLNISQFEKDIDEGLAFESNIPLGYGLGSSGALVAAVYERYARFKIPEEDLITLKRVFAAMESYFHGKSSGLDPLVCYLQKAVKVEKNNRLQVVEQPHFEKKSGGGLFLLDTATTGETQPLVNYFMGQCQKPDFLQQIKSKLVPLNAKCIRAYLTGDSTALFSCMEKLSAFTLRYFRPMVPEKLFPLWEKGWKDKSCFLKLCGSGGGGMMLGVTRNFEKAKELLNSFSLEIFQEF